MRSFLLRASHGNHRSPCRVHVPASPASGMIHSIRLYGVMAALSLIAGEAVLPVGSLSASTPTYSLKGLMTKTLSLGRIQLNAGGGTWSIRVPRPGPVVVPNQCGDPGQPVCIPPDVACTVAPSDAVT